NIDEGITALLNLEERLEEDVIDEETLIAGLARVGSEEPEIKADYPRELRSHEFGSGLHSLVVFGDLHFMEINSLINLADAPEDIEKER
ncbi:MAG: diphthine synthase, partial [Candidatus Thermoplasmatota archaeon]